ncbi:MAG: LCP family protein [Solirubrobacteraceae bacterium]
MWKRFLLAGTLIVLATAASVSTAVLLEVDRVVDVFRANNEALAGIEEVLDDVEAGEPQTILLLGSDDRYDDRVAGIPGRSDTMILVRLDPDREVTSILSIPRDLKVRIPTDGSAPASAVFDEEEAPPSDDVLADPDAAPADLAEADSDGDGVVVDKINTAYAIGGPRLAVQTIKDVFGLEVNHFVNVNFGGFRRAVNRVDCVYVDIDRRYFNDNMPPADSASPYATIDVQPGYQRLCGQDSLDYVRYRHTDTDIVRGARQQDWLAQAKDQVGVERIFRDRDELVRIFGTYTQTNIASNTAILRLLKLIYESSRNPLAEVRFRGEVGEPFVTVSEEDLERMSEEFLLGEQTRGSKGDGGRGDTGRAEEDGEGPEDGEGSDGGGSGDEGSGDGRDAIPAGLEDAAREGQDQAAAAAVELDLPVYYPRLRTELSDYMGQPRVYPIEGPDGERHEAYRMVLDAEGVGEYVGVQGTAWRDPPILDSPSEVRRLAGRDYMLFFDGSRLARIGWRTERGSYWVSNTLLRSLSNREMLGIARSLTRIGSQG